jgi:hypothetical protein
MMIAARETAHVQERHRLHRHHLVRAMEEQRVHAVVVRARRHVQLAQHVFDRVHGLVEVRERRVLAAEHREVAHTLGVRRVNLGEVASERLAEIRAAVIRRATGVL